MAQQKGEVLTAKYTKFTKILDIIFLSFVAFVLEYTYPSERVSKGKAE